MSAPLVTAAATEAPATGLAALEPVTGETLTAKIIGSYRDSRRSENDTRESIPAGELFSEQKAELKATVGHGEWMQWCSQSIPQVKFQSEVG